jgi:signal transduction histidine kinase
MMHARVMVVEDERIVALHLRQQLVKLGYDVAECAASGEQALRQVAAARPDLILMDIHIDGSLDGIETAARLPADDRIPVIYLTAYSEEATLERARATRPYGYLVKPFAERELHATIQMALERRRDEKVRHETEAARHQEQKLQVVGELAGGVAHDFNNLLGTIIANMELAADHAGSDPALREMLQDTLEAALRGANLTQQLLAYSRRQPLAPRMLNIGRLLADLADLLRRTLGKKIQLRMCASEDLWQVCVDPSQISTALVNLAVNARDAMPRGGTLTIEAGNVTLDQAAVRRRAEVVPGAYVRIAVTDTGTGMSRDVLERAHEPFFTTKPVGKGPGLGLSMVQGFVRQSNGHIGVLSGPGRGTTIELHFPAAGVTAADDAAAEVDQSMPLARRGEVILIAEDDPAVRKFVASQVTSLGYAAIAAKDGTAACRALARAERVDLLLTDVVLPNGMSGPALARAARARRPNLRLLFMSGYPRGAVPNSEEMDAADHLLAKPFRKAELARELRRVLDWVG